MGQGRFDYDTLEQLEADLGRLGLTLPIERDLSPLKESIRIASLTVPNRLVIHPMEGCDGTADGSPDELTFRRYRRFAAGGAGLLWFEATAVLPEARANPRQLHLHHGNLAAFRRLVAETARAAAEAGWPRPVMLLQLTHSGRYSNYSGTLAPIIAHHNPVLDPRQKLPPDHPLVGDDYLDQLGDAYAAAARLAREAGFDGVDVKSCHRYLLNELLASYERPGPYGGSYENRTRLLRETIARIMAEVPDLFVTTRLNVYDGLPFPFGFGADRRQEGEIDLAEPIRLVADLAALGIPLLNLTIGNPYHCPHLNRPFDHPVKGAPGSPEPPLAGVVRFLAVVRDIQRSQPGLPIIGAGYSWLRHLFPQVAAGALKNGWASLIGLGRIAFAYPEAPGDILKTGRLDPAKTCITCSGCTQLMREKGRVGCVIRDGDHYPAP